MKLQNIKSNKANGFTIIELLVVIVVIAILASITMVSYTGITARANTSASKTTANAVIQKAEVYFTEKSLYPETLTKLTGTSTSDSWYISGVSLYKAGTPAVTAKLSSQPSDTKTISYYVCGYYDISTTTANMQYGKTQSGTNYPIVTITGAAAAYWDYSTNHSEIISTGNVGTYTGSSATWANGTLTLKDTTNTDVVVPIHCELSTN